MASGTIKAVLSRGDVANNLTTSTAGKVLDASQGKILSDQMSHLYVASNTVATLADLVTLISSYANNANIQANVSSTVVNALSNSTTSYDGVVTVLKISANNCYYHVFNNQVMAYGNLKLNTGTVNIINDLGANTVMLGPPITETTQSAFEASLKTVLDGMDNTTIKEGYCYPNFNTFGGTLGSYVLSRRQSGVYLATISVAGVFLVGYYYSSEWHWSKFTGTAI